MRNITIRKLSDIAHYRKEFIEINDNSTYKRCRVQLHKRGVILRDIIKGSDIKTKKQRLCKNNDFIVAEMDAKFGGYGIIPYELEKAIVSSHYYLYELDKEKILPKYLEVLIDTDVIQNQIKAKGTTNYSRVSPNEVLNYEIPCPSISQQKQIIEYYLESKIIILNIKNELYNQVNILKKLRQAVLQEAIEGQLTANWRKANLELVNGENGVEKLLEHIKAEKQKLIDEGKIKKEKPLPPITDEEKAFKLPEGWVWCRLGDLFEIQRGSSPRPKGDSRYFSKTKTQYHWITISDITAFTENDILYNTKEFLTKLGTTKSRYVTEKDVIIAVSGSVGKCALLGIKGFIYDGLMVIKNIKNEIFREYVYLVIKTFTNTMLNDAIGSTWKNINTYYAKSLILPLPSLNEQNIILNHIKKINDSLFQLEQQIKNRKEYTKKLMKSVLRKAFEITPVRRDAIQTQKEESLNTFQQMQIIGTVIKQLENYNMRQGEMVLAKYLYLLYFIYGIKIGFCFTKWHFGPYDTAIKRIVGNRKYFKKYGKPGFETIVLVNYKKLLKYSNKQVSAVNKNMGELIRLFQEYNTTERNNKIELLASILKVIEDDCARTVDEVYQGLQEWETDKVITKGYSNKAEKFSRYEVSKCLEFVKQKGWI